MGGDFLRIPVSREDELDIRFAAGGFSITLSISTFESWTHKCSAW